MAEKKSPSPEMALSIESTRLLERALQTLEQVGSEAMGQMPSLEDAPVAKEPAAKRPARPRRADLRLWDALLELDVEAARQAFEDGAPASTVRSGLNAFDRWLEGVGAKQQAWQQAEHGGAREAQQAFDALQSKAREMLELLASRGAAVARHGSYGDKEEVETSSQKGRLKGVRSWRDNWYAVPLAARPLLAGQAIAWSKEDSPNALKMSQTLSVAFEEGAYYWNSEINFAATFCEQGVKVEPAHWDKLEKSLYRNDSGSQVEDLKKILAVRHEPLSARLGALCAQVAINADDAKMLLMVAQKGGLGCEVGYGERHEPTPTLLWALQHNAKTKVDPKAEGGATLGRDCFEALAKIPQMVEAAREGFKAEALGSVDGEEALSLLKRFPFMAEPDKQGQNIAHAWVDGRWLSIHSINKFKKLLNGGFAHMLSQPNKKGKTPLDVLKAGGGTRALRQAVADWDATYAKWEKKDMKTVAPAPRSVKKTVSKRL